MHSSKRMMLDQRIDRVKMLNDYPRNGESKLILEKYICFILKNYQLNFCRYRKNIIIMYNIT